MFCKVTLRYGLRHNLYWQFLYGYRSALHANISQCFQLNHKGSVLYHFQFIFSFIQTFNVIYINIYIFVYLFIMGTRLVNKKAHTVASTSSWKPYGSLKTMNLYQTMAILERSALEFRTWLSSQGFCYNFPFIATEFLAERSCYLRNSYCWESTLLILIFYFEL